jgi:superfamily II DNA/RNA helicase
LYLRQTALTFEDFNFTWDLLDGLDATGFINPTPIQQAAIPLIQQQKDLIACAQTGTGKTAAFLLPILDEFTANPRTTTGALIIVPTRELALQIDQTLQGLAYYTPVNSLVMYGGGDGAGFEREKKALQEGANIVVATPGKLMSHMNLGNTNFDHLEFLVLDEADRMLNMGFIDDIMRIISFLPKSRQSLLFSATMPPKIRDLAAKILVNPEQINIAVSKPAERVKQGAFVVYENQKIPTVVQLLKDQKDMSILIFASTKIKVKELEKELRRSGVAIKAIHSDLVQAEREEVLMGFRSKRIPVLVATDVLSRGIDIDDIGIVLNFDVPADAEDYIHRIGRTARGAAEGQAYTLISPLDQNKFHRIESLMDMVVEKLPIPEQLGPAPEYKPGKSHAGGNPKFKNKGKFNSNKKGNFKPKGSQGPPK